MLNFIVLGILPGTNLIITLTWVLIATLLLIVSAIIWVELRHNKVPHKQTKSTDPYLTA
jgi:hypothetical protein